jgi:four helix bundle protein
MHIKSYKDLTVWQKSIELVKKIYKLTSDLPKSEVYGLSIQMRRAAISIPSNIAEGYLRKNLKEYLQFLRVAYSSSAELETQLILAKALYLNFNCRETESLLEEVQKMLSVIIKKLENK